MPRLAKAARATRTLSADQARRLALAAGGFTRPKPDTVGTRQLTAVVRRMGALQIDSVNVFSRSHYLPLFSRLGRYDQNLLDRLAFSPRPAFVEYWAHVAALIPASDWRLFQFRMDELYAKHGAPPESWVSQHGRVVAWVRSELAARGPLRAAEIEQDAPRENRGAWWDWDEVKQALEYLWYFGEVAIAGRRGFERRYALAADVIPAEVLARPVPRADAYRELIRRACRSYGVATAADLADYWRLNDRRAVREAIGDLVDAGELIPVTVHGWNASDKPVPAWMPADTVVPRQATVTTLLTPFDPLVWFRERAKRVFGVDYRIEIYTPKERRQYGYYSLPVLAGDTIVGRVDLKADRAASMLRIQSAWWEPGADRDTRDQIAAELRRAAAWQGLDRMSVSHWGNATADLAEVLPEAQRH